MQIQGLVGKVEHRVSQNGNVEFTLQILDETAGVVRVRWYPSAAGEVPPVEYGDVARVAVSRFNGWSPRSGGVVVDFYASAIARA